MNDSILDKFKKNVHLENIIQTDNLSYTDKSKEVDNFSKYFFCLLLFKRYIWNVYY